MSDLYSLTPTQIVIYSKAWCPDCRRSKRVLDENRVNYLEVDIDHDMDGKAFVRRLNNGNESVPTIIFPDGSFLVEPGSSMLVAKISLS